MLVTCVLSQKVIFDRHFDDIYLLIIHFVLIYLIVCLCGAITRWYLSSLIMQFCNTIVCLFPKLSVDIRFRMMDANCDW